MKTPKDFADKIAKEFYAADGWASLHVNAVTIIAEAMAEARKAALEEAAAAVGDLACIRVHGHDRLLALAQAGAAKGEETLTVSSVGTCKRCGYYGPWAGAGDGKPPSTGRGEE